MRIGGIASGMDTETLINDLMKAERMPLTKITQKKQTLQWQLDSYRAVNRKVKEFSDNVFNNMVLSTKFNAKITESSAPNDVSINNKNSTSDFSGTIKIEQLAKNSTMQSRVIEAGAGKSAKTTMADLGITGTTLKISAIDENGVMKDTDVTIASTDTIQSVMDKITKQTGVNAFYDAKSGQIALSTKNGGNNGTNGPSEIVVTSTGDVASKLGLDGEIVANTNKGQNAIYTVNGLKMESSKNIVDVNGFEFTLKAANNTDINFSTKPDTDAVFENIVKFVDDYNKLMDELNSLVREKPYRDFKPLSAEEKEAMSDKEVELWEEKAKSGLLRNDPMISGMITKMRSALMGSVKDQGSLKDIGIATPGGQYAWQQDGKLVVDEKKLKEAINADPDKVQKIFSQTGTATTPGSTTGEQGFAVRLRAIAESSYKDIHKRAGDTGSTEASFTLGRNLKAINEQMDKFQTRLKMVENRYWKQFSAMENAIQRANAQSANLMNALGGGA
ncbi:flagellar filament capping protein FliD [Psychrobacillus psychrodurans]|uniref:flagellar filament capping protein FliD n=1 Tax=Psychrobacillus psychrodurans TaxID=126157 RepID=UPI001F4EE5C0|nr:flagellar filament capping protein FliD [Psychrobacillus psychrodurans]MCK1995987.1 flagellar filament capping protein FliD [Psychrobacillus psychrodurans]